MKGLIKWGAFAVELCLSFVLLSCVSICRCPPNSAYIGQIVLLAIASGACAYLSSSQFQQPWPTTPIKMWQLFLEPPVAVWVISMVLLILQLTGHGYVPANRDYILYRTK
jgi:hypothetical protein